MKTAMKFDVTKIDNIEVENIRMDDYPDFVDAYISYADYDGRPMTEDEIETLNDEYSDFVYEQVWNWIH